MSRSLRILSALQVRVPPGGDKVPQLNDLGLPAEATIDPFNGPPLRVEKVPEGWMVYSVGSNGVDDGGKLDQRTDVGVGPVSRGFGGPSCSRAAQESWAALLSVDRVPFEAGFVPDRRSLAWGLIVYVQATSETRRLPADGQYTLDHAGV